ncbi:DUF6882 domain-containing protein [Sediminivirga luteola]|uniref:Uncharacterized protein n=1 Tax=Sediminivirga luteola TaxID=1774748 RepID=A0A8J2XKC1_9MICO|nr:DUF6882 domain-containing protein [Sediminivirga luteola]GGA13286.1 hypothetical protein GCM10011333_15280 [Sediminivirga luteola]
MSADPGPLERLVDQAVFLSAEYQAHFATLVGERDWDVDFQRPVLRFAAGDGSPALELRPHFLGSYAQQPSRSWHWGWDNINGFPPAAVELAGQLKTLAAGAGLPEANQDEIEVPRDSELPFRLTLAAKALTGVYAHYAAPAGGGTQAWLLVEAPELALSEPSIMRIVPLVAQSLQATEISDHRAALESYIRLRGLASRPLPGSEGGLRLIAADGGADVEFDELNRITSFTKVELDPEDRALLAEAAPVALQPLHVTVSPAAAAPVEPERGPSSASQSHEPAGTAPSTPPASHDGRAESTGAPAETRPEASPGTAARPSTADRQGEQFPEQTADQSVPAHSAGERPESSPAEDQPAEGSGESARDEPKQEKRGLFSRLFGR